MPVYSALVLCNLTAPKGHECTKPTRILPNGKNNLLLSITQKTAKNKTKNPLFIHNFVEYFSSGSYPGIYQLVAAMGLLFVTHLYLLI